MDQAAKPGMYKTLVDAAMRGETPMTLRDWQNSQSQMPVSSPR